MKNVTIQDLKPGLVCGVEVHIPLNENVYKETYFEWAASPLIANMKDNHISGGTLKCWHNVAEFREVESHVDAEMFYFISGVALMLFIDLKKGEPDMDTAQIVRIQANTQIIIAPGKTHFIPVAENDEPVNIIVVSPKVDAPRVNLSTIIKGI